MCGARASLAYGSGGSSKAMGFLSGDFSVLAMLPLPPGGLRRGGGFVDEPRSSLVRATGMADRAPLPAGSAQCGCDVAADERAVQLGIEPAGGVELVVRATLDDASLIHHEDHVGVGDRRQAMGDHD